MSDYLVDFGSGKKPPVGLTDALAAAYCHLAESWITPLPAPTSTLTTWQDFSRRVLELNKPIEIRQAPNVVGGRWPAVEVLNVMNHVEVLLRAALALEKAGWTFTRCMPSQQYLAEGETAALPKTRAADLEGKDAQGETFALEAYGGVDYRNNSKLALDLNALRQCKKAHLLLAARTGAWPSNLSKQLVASCEKRSGGPFKIEASIVRRWDEDGHVSLLEMTDIVRETPARGMA